MIVSTSLSSKQEASTCDVLTHFQGKEGRCTEAANSGLVSSKRKASSS